MASAMSRSVVKFMVKVRLDAVSSSSHFGTVMVAKCRMAGMVPSSQRRALYRTLRAAVRLCCSSEDMGPRTEGTGIEVFVLAFAVARSVPRATVVTASIASDDADAMMDGCRNNNPQRCLPHPQICPERITSCWPWKRCSQLTGAIALAI
jgi:hypothetical protein